MHENALREEVLPPLDDTDIEVGELERQLWEGPDINTQAQKLLRGWGLQGDCPTRWSSTYMLLSRAIELEGAIKASLQSIPTTTSPLLNGECSRPYA